MRLTATLRTVAAVLVVGLLAGGFLAVLRLRAGASSAKSTWQDRGITVARARGGPLDFDPAKGVTYAVSDAAPGAIYVCGSNHLWYSQDGGQTYRPFTPALPIGDAQNCAIATVPGAPGLFTNLPDPQAPSSASPQYVVAYATPGAASWHVIRVKSSIPAPRSTAGVAVDGDQFWAQIANNGTGDQVRAVGNWLILLLPTPGNVGGPGVPVATPDLGQTWVWLDRAGVVDDQYLSCYHLYTDATNPSHIFCAGYKDTPSPHADIYETRDGGMTWAATGIGTVPVPALRFVSGADTQAVYVTAPPSVLMRRSMTGGEWQGVTAFTDVTDTLVAGTMPDDSVYIVAGMQAGTERQLQVLRLAPGTKSPVDYGEPLVLSSKDDAVTNVLGDAWPGGQPALYVYGANQPSTHTFWRLPLVPLENQPRVDTTPLAGASATSVSVPTCPTYTSGNMTAIQPGGLGADISTFVPRWGSNVGTVRDTTYFGPYADSGTPQVGVLGPADNGRVFSLYYSEDTVSESQLTPAQAESLVESIVPTDAVEQGPPQWTTPYGPPVQVAYYCSAAFAASFPAGTKTPFPYAVPLTVSGLIEVTYTQDGGGMVRSIVVQAYGTPAPSAL